MGVAWRGRLGSRPARVMAAAVVSLALVPGPTWDYYLLFSSRARWGTVPGPIVSQGGPVIADSGQLLAAIGPLLR